MYNTTTALASALATQKLYTKVVYGSTTIGAEQVKKCVYSGSFGGADTVTIGGVTAAMVTLTLSGAHNLMDKTITVSIGADVSGTVQYVPLGTFAVATCKQVDDTTAVTAYDAAYYALGGTYTPTVSSGTTVAAVLSDVATQCGLTLATLPAAASTTGVVGDLTGKTCRDMVGYLAALVGCNALIDRDGKLALRWFASSGQSYSPSDYYNAGLSIDGTSTLGCIQATAEETTTDADGNTSVTTNTYTAGGTGVGIAIQNPYMTQAILDTVWASIGGLAYTVGSCDIFHGLLTEPGDLVTITDKAGVAHTLAVMSLELSIDGGCRAKIQATADSATDTGANVTGSMTKQITKIAKDVTEFYTIVAQKAKVTDLEAANAEISNLKTEKANVADLNAATGRIDDLEADTASLGQAVAEKASISDLTATNAEVSNLKTSKADVDLLNVAKATIESLLVRGGIITDSLTGVEINATKFLTGVTIIGDVIKAGTLAANRIILTGENGLIYELNVNAGNLTASQLTEEQYKQALDGSVLVASSITTDKLAAGSVTAQVIASGAVTTDKLEVGAVKAKHIDVDDLFAQNITATGTITGAKLNGVEVNGQQFHLRSQSSPPEGFYPSFVEIDAGAESSYQRIRLGSGYVQDGTDVSAGYIYLDSDGKIQMGGITIHFNGMSFFPNGIYGDLTGTASKATKADSADNASKLSGLAVGKRWGNIPQIGTDGVMEVGKYLDFHDGDNADSTDYDARITCNGDIILIPKLLVDKITDNSYSTTTYTSFSGSVLSSGSVTVTKKLGVCYIIGTLTLSGKVSSWTTILGSSAIPAPQHGVLVPFEMSQWKASYAQALRGKITPDGELQLVYGAAGNYVINISYPID